MKCLLNGAWPWLQQVLTSGVHYPERWVLTTPPCFCRLERSLPAGDNVAPSFDIWESAPDGLGFTLFRGPEGAMEEETRTLPGTKQAERQGAEEGCFQVSRLEDGKRRRRAKSAFNDRLNVDVTSHAAARVDRLVLPEAGDVARVARVARLLRTATVRPERGNFSCGRCGSTAGDNFFFFPARLPPITAFRSSPLCLNCRRSVWFFGSQLTLCHNGQWRSRRRCEKLNCPALVLVFLSFGQKVLITDLM